MKILKFFGRSRDRSRMIVEVFLEHLDVILVDFLNKIKDRISHLYKHLYVHLYGHLYGHLYEHLYGRLYELLWSFTSLPGGNQVDGLPPEPSPNFQKFSNVKYSSIRKIDAKIIKRSTNWAPAVNRQPGFRRDDS